MQHEEAHLSDEELLLAADGELAPRDVKRVNAHLTHCWACRARMSGMETGIADLVRLHRRSLDAPLPPAGASRASLKAQLSQLAAAPQRPRWQGWLANIGHGQRIAGIAAALTALLFLVSYDRTSREARAVPATRLTPGATRQVALQDLCSGQYSKNAQVIPVVQRQVFARYGLENVEPGAYEVDYLITPALGGADDIRNLWPQPYSSTIWNAAVKDELEDRLHTMVCSGELDLASAQQDIARDWIGAYKKYFHTDWPVSSYPAKP
jgi:anti-sigma factor RsiW